MPKSPYFERIPGEEAPGLRPPPLEKGERGISLEMVRPRRGELEMPELTPEEKARLRSLMNQAKQAEEENRLPEAIELYQKVKTEFLAIKERKEKEKRGETGELKFTVPDAENPFREAMLWGGIPETDPAAVEHRDIEVDLEKVLEADLSSYRASELEDWASAIEAVRGDLRLTPEKRQIIEQEIKDGAIPIFMPGSSSQLETTPEQYQKNLKPVLIVDGEEQAVADAYLWDYLANLITQKHPSLVQDVPERPYILLIKPTQKPEPRTTNKTVDEQKAELQTMNQEREEQGLAPVRSINPAEYAALQKRFTETVKDAFPNPPEILNPFDKDTFTRFIDLPLSSDGLVPCGCWLLVGRQVGFGRGDAALPDAEDGVRFSVRVEI